MATIYFTNNADSGDGSLRAAIADANPGDVITYDDTAFASVDTVVVSCSATLYIQKEVTVDGREKRIVLDGQGVTRPLYLMTTVTIKQLDILRGNASFGSGVTVSAGASVLEHCRICGCFCSDRGGAAFIAGGAIAFRDCLIVGNRADGGYRAAVHAQTEGSATLVRCTAVGNRDITLNATTTSSITVQDSFIQGAHNVPDVTSITPSAAGFVAPPPDTIDPESWNNALWQSWDFRLTPESPYLTGAETSEGEVDVLGNPRKANGSIGAYEGAWIVGNADIGEYTTADYVDAPDGATITFANGATLTATAGAFVGAATFTGDGYFATPTGTDTSTATFDGVTAYTYGADITHFRAFFASDSTIGFATDRLGTAPYLLEKYNPQQQAWEVLTTAADETTTCAVGVGDFMTFRAADGVNTFTDQISLENRGEFWKVDGWAVFQVGGETEAGTGEAWSVNAWGLSPNIKEA